MTTAQDQFNEEANMTNPRTMYFINTTKENSLGNAVAVEHINQEQQNVKEGIRDAVGGLKGVSNLENVSSEAAKSSNISGEKQDKGGRSY